MEPSGTLVLGHSFGGVVALHLASRPGIRAVIGLGVKVAWTSEELDRAAALAGREPARFATREEAVARHLRLSGLHGLVAPDAPAALAGAVQQDGMWRPALDPRAFGVGDPQVAHLLEAAPVPVVLARGEHDAMVSAEQLRALVPDPVDLPGLGHNAHVEAPDAVAGLVLTHSRWAS
jgi:pimeloyl-ACP methyl ester carboxylesterase